MYYINTFFIYSIIGFIFERFILNTKSGILHGPLTPIYGIGAIIIIIVSKYIFKNLHLSKFTEVLISAILLTIILTLLEFLTGIIIEKAFNIVFWDYTKLPLNIGKYIALPVSLGWFIASFLLIYFIKPILDKLIIKIPNYLTLTLIIFLLLDITYTIIKGIDK